MTTDGAPIWKVSPYERFVDDRDFGSACIVSSGEIPPRQKRCTNRREVMWCNAVEVGLLVRPWRLAVNHDALPPSAAVQRRVLRQTHRRHASNMLKVFNQLLVKGCELRAPIPGSSPVYIDQEHALMPKPRVEMAEVVEGTDKKPGGRQEQQRKRHLEHDERSSDTVTRAAAYARAPFQRRRQSERGAAK